MAQTHRLDRLIEQLLPNEADRAFARDWAARLDTDGAGERAEALIREVAALTKRAETDPTAAERAREYMTDFARSIGMPDHQIQSSLAWIDAGGRSDAAAQEETLKNLPPEAQQAIAAADREAARREVSKYEDLMRRDPQAYWGSAANQDAYRQALERSLAAPAPTTAPVDQGGGQSLPGAAEPAAAAPASAVPAPAAAADQVQV